MLRPAGLAAQRLSHRLQVFRLQTPEGLTKTFLRWKSYKSGPQCLRKGDTPPYPFILSTERRSPGPGHGEAVGFLEEPPHARTRRAGAGTCRDMPGFKVRKSTVDSHYLTGSFAALPLRFPGCLSQAVTGTAAKLLLGCRSERASDDVPEEFRARHLTMTSPARILQLTQNFLRSQRCTILLKGNAFGSSGHVSEMPIDSIVTYFGIHTAEYFAFLHEYATWLLLPAVLGVAVQAVLSLGHDGLDEVRGSCSGAWALGAEGLVAGLALVGLGSAQPRRHISQAFMVFMSARSLKEFTGVGLSPKKGPELKVWTTAFIEHWKRCRAGLHYQFGARLEDRQAEAECEAPAAYCIETKRLQLIPSLARAFAAGSRQRAESDHEVAGGAGRSGPGRVRDLSKDKEQGLATLLEVVLSLLSLVDSHFELQTHVSGVVYLLLRLGEADAASPQHGINAAWQIFLQLKRSTEKLCNRCLPAEGQLEQQEVMLVGLQWPLAVFMVSVLVLGLLLRALDGLFFSEEAPAGSEDMPEAGRGRSLCGQASEASRPVSKPAGDDAKVAEVVAAVRAGNMELAEAKMAERWLSFLAEKGRPPVITANAKEKNPVAAEKIVAFMCKHGIEPDVITLGAAVHAFAHAGQQKEAERMPVAQILSTTFAAGPDVIGFNALIDASVKVGDTKRAEYWLERMLEIGLEPNVVSYTTVLHAHAKHGNIEAAETMMKLMKSNGIEANVVTYTALVNACVKAGDLPCAERRAERLLERMCQDRVTPTEVCFNNVIDACSKASDVNSSIARLKAPLPQAGQAARAEHWLWRLAEGKDITADLAPTRQSFTAAAQAADREAIPVDVNVDTAYAKLGSFGDVERLFRAMAGHHQAASPCGEAEQQKSVLGAQRLEQLCAEMGMQVPDLNDFAEERRPWRRQSQCCDADQRRSVSQVAQQRSDSVVIQNIPEENRPAVVVQLPVQSAFPVKLQKTLLTVFYGRVQTRLYQKGVSSLVHMEGLVCGAFEVAHFEGWFLYVAFCIQDLDYLRSQLLSFMTVKQEEGAVEVRNCSSFVSKLRLQVSFVGSSSVKLITVVAVAQEVLLPVDVFGSCAQDQKGTSLEKDVGRQLALDKTDLCTEYQQLVVLFALTSSFAAERSDGYKFLMVRSELVQLPFRDMQPIVISDTWVEVLEALSIVSVVCNVAVLAVSGSRWTALSLAVLEHALLIFKASAIGTVPGRWPGNLGVPAMAASGAGNVARFSSVPMFSVPKMDSFPAPCLITSDESGSTDITDQDEFAGLDAGTASSTTCEDYPEDEESVELRGLPFSTTLEAGSQVMRDGRPSGLANVHFRTKEASLRAIDALHMQELGGRYIEVGFRAESLQAQRQKARGIAGDAALQTACLYSEDAFAAAILEAGKLACSQESNQDASSFLGAMKATGGEFMVPEMYVKVQLKHYHSSPSKTRGRCMVAHGSLPTLLGAAGAAVDGSKEPNAEAESAPTQEVMVTEDQKKMCAAIHSSQMYACLNCGTTLAEKSTQLRHRSFSEVGTSVDKDGMGWPSVSAYMLRNKKADCHGLFGGRAATMSNIEMFQRDNIFFCGLLGSLCGNAWNANICLSTLCTYTRACCAADVADESLVSSTLDDSFFNDLFNKHFGGTLLRAPSLHEDTFGVENAVVCDLQESLVDLELRQGRLFQPCKVFFRQDEKMGLLVEAIAIMDTESSQPALYQNQTSSLNEWLWAKRIAVAGALQRHQFEEHLVLGHMVMETFVALAYKHLTADHYVFKLLEPMCSDVGFLNRSWGLDFLLTNKGAPYEAVLKFLAPQSMLSRSSLIEQLTRARERFDPRSWFWFDQGGYMKGGSGVKESTAFPVRDTAEKLFDAMLLWTSAVVDMYWEEQDEALQSWWKALWWNPMKQARRKLSPETLSHLLATCILQSTYVHDLAHEAWLPENHSQLTWTLRSRAPGSTDPRDYLPTAKEQNTHHLGLMALNGSSLESPILSYRKVFPKESLQQQLKTFEDSLTRVVLATPHMKSLGSMSH
ncbi:Pentatricopeptide repeat-containing protein [Symbiodinium microadriaticum]|uniref:Pentatricopeptide repeat-containing protein n=1 Tax=Symbiodinium microadriaticum TaxID=2951 RepID=A0A1Q9DFN1_SYMMI|nr:Pentatricopeptide repeat-containing protein [Symbiodinium microadriaticum]